MTQPKSLCTAIRRALGYRCFASKLSQRDALQRHFQPFGSGVLVEGNTMIVRPWRHPFSVIKLRLTPKQRARKRKAKVKKAERKHSLRILRVFAALYKQATQGRVTDNKVKSVCWVSACFYIWASCSQCLRRQPVRQLAYCSSQSWGPRL